MIKIGNVEMQDFNGFCTQWNNAASRVGSRTPGEEHAIFWKEYLITWDMNASKSKLALDNPALRSWGLYNPTREGFAGIVKGLIRSEPKR